MNCLDLEVTRKVNLTHWSQLFITRTQVLIGILEYTSLSLGRLPFGWKSSLGLQEMQILQLVCKISDFDNLQLARVAIHSFLDDNAALWRLFLWIKVTIHL